MVAGPDAPETDLLEELGRHLRAADSLLSGLADDMAAVGARTASERTQRARDELAAAQRIADRLRDPGGDAAGR